MRTHLFLFTAGCGLVLALALPVQGVPPSHGPGSLDLTFDPTAGGTQVGLTGGSPSVHAVASLPDGRVLIGGWFHGVNGVPHNNVARLNFDGTVDPTFQPGLGADGAVTGLALQADGKVIIIGSFGRVGGQPHPLIARLEADGTVDATFNCRLTGDLHLRLDSLAVQPSGQIWIGGRFTNVNGVARLNLARLNPDGGLDPSFDPQQIVTGSNTAIHRIRLQQDGKVLVSGTWDQPRRSLVRLNADGSLDPGFGPVVITPSGYYDYIYDMFIHTDGTIALVGTFESVNGVTRRYAARLGANGALDTGFSADFGRWATAAGSVVVQPDGRIAVGGWFTEVSGVQRLGLAQLYTDGSLDPDFDSANVIGRPPGTAYQPNVQALALHIDGYVIVGAYPWWLRDNTDSVFRLDPQGRRDPGFSPWLQAAPDSVINMARQPDGKTIIGLLGNPAGLGAPWLVRLDSNGLIDESFRPDGNLRWLGALTVQPDGKILMNHAGGQSVLRLSDDGSVDFAFQAPPILGYKQGIETMAVQSDGKILIGGLLREVGGTAYPGIARLDADGQLDTDFQPLPFSIGDDPGGGVEHILVLPEGRIFIGGGFMWDDGAYTAAGLALLHADGTLDSNFLANIPAPGYVWAAALQTDGKILLSGTFLEPGGGYYEGLVRLNADGTEDTTFQPDVPGVFSALAVQADGRILAVRSWETNGIIRLHPNGSLDSTFQGPSELSGVDRLILQPDGRVLVAGAFDSVNGIPRHGVARLNNDVGWRLEVDAQTVPGQFQLTITGRPGARVLVEASTNLTDWIPLDEVTTAAFPIVFIDADAAQFRHRFYRVREAASGGAERWR
jgi:uncharacterized delta-60 repeat protein